MTIRTQSIPTAGRPVALDVRNFSGSVSLEAVDGAETVEVRVEPLDAAAEQALERVDIEASPSDPGDQRPTTVRVAVPERRLLRAPSFAITVTVPADADARVAVGSADTVARGHWGRVNATAASGDVDVEECAELHLRTASGDARVGAVSGRATVATASGDVRGRSFAAGIDVGTASGDVTIEEAGGDVAITTASGDVTVRSVADGTVRVKTVSGDATIGVAQGRRVWLDLSSVSGRMGSDLDDDAADGDDGRAQVSLALRSVSGDLRIHRATFAPPVG